MPMLYRCSAVGPQNHNRLQRCDFEFAFDIQSVYHCPHCGSRMRPVPEGLSIIETIAKGSEHERRKKASSQRPSQS